MSYIRNNRILLLITSVLLVANIGLLYYFVFNKPAHPPRPSDKEMHDMEIEKVKNEVGLNNEQAVSYVSLRSQQLMNMKPLFRQLTKSKEDFFLLIYQQGVNDSVLSSYASKIGE